MTPRERVYRAIQFQETDIVPYVVGLTQVAHQKMVEYYGDPDFSAKLGHHIASISHRPLWRWTEVEPGHWMDDWGVIWNRTIDKDIGNVENRVLPEPSLDGLRPPDPKTSGIADAYPGFIAANPDRFRIASIGFSLFERAWTLRGFDRLLMDMVENPDFVHALLDKITEVTLEHLEIALNYDVDGVYFGDDWGSQRGMLMSPTTWREFIKPRIKRLYGRAHQAGKYVFIHSCGDVKAVLQDLVEVGLNVFNPFQPEVMDIFETKRRYYGQLSFYGGISVQTLLPRGTPHEVRDETRMLLKTLGKGGGYIASPSHAVPADAPAENIAAMIEVLENQYEGRAQISEVRGQPGSTSSRTCFGIRFQKSEVGNRRPRCRP